MSVRPSVRWSVGPSVRRSVGEHELKSGKMRISATAHPSATGIGRVSGLVYDFITLTSLLLPNGLVTSNIAPAHPHATLVAVHPALFLKGGGTRFVDNCLPLRD